MSHFYVEQRRVGDDTSLSRDIAMHLSTRQLPGITIILAERPPILLASLRKQWQKQARALQVERASTLNPARIQELSQMAARMEHAHFTTLSNITGNNEVIFATPEQFLKQPVVCHTMYLTMPMLHEQVSEVAQHIQFHGLLVRYS